jgi:predicted TIM-barrel fold metal-dependent hydrolase
MKTSLTDLNDFNYLLIDADGHVNEPPELWQEGVAVSLRERAPKLLETAHGDVWAFEGGARMRPLGLNAVAGLSVVQFRDQGLRYTDIRPGSFDQKSRLHDMDADGIWAQVLYPSVVLEGARLFGDDRQLQLACVRAYNEWLAEFCHGAEHRLIGQAIMPTTGVDDAIAEMRRGIELGHRGAILSAYPNGTASPDVDDERFWAFAEEASLPVAVHVGSFSRAGPPSTYPSFQERSFLAVAAAAKSGLGVMKVCCSLLFSGVFQRFRRTKLVLTEANIGWIPTLLEQTDNMFFRYRWITAAEHMQELPSQLFHRNVWVTFIIDTVGLDLRYRMNQNHLMWSTDYPHTPCDWPNSRLTALRQFRGLPLDEVRGFVHGNARELYGLDIPDEQPGGRDQSAG